MSNERIVTFAWLFDNNGLICLERNDSIKGISKAVVTKGKIDSMFRDESGLGVAFVPQKYKDELKNIKKSVT